MNKNIFEIASLRENNDYEFWRKRTYPERIAAVEKLRRITFGYDPSTERLQRVFTVTQLKKN